MTNYQLMYQLLSEKTLTSGLALSLYQRGWTSHLSQEKIQTRVKQYATLFIVLLFMGGINMLIKQNIFIEWCSILLLLSPLFLFNILVTRESLYQRQIQRSIPTTLEGLLLCNGAGLSIHQSIDRLSHFLDKRYVLQREWMIASHQLQAGLNLDHVLDTLLQRNPHTGLERLIILLKSQHRFGHELEKGLLDEIEQHHREREQHIQALTATLNLKLLMPLLGCFLPSLVLMILIPSVIQLTTFLN
ncbi:MAG: type II secretion system F family protein [Betaproteobacteria bacterium]|nr:type II secretion system F family protein [Betaproteobacteria bacterium]MDE2055928.1 type II secretion system F family protein [Betaproteobacteria bacterium]